MDYRREDDWRLIRGIGERRNAGTESSASVPPGVSIRLNVPIDLQIHHIETTLSLIYMEAIENDPLERLFEREQLARIASDHSSCWS